MLLCQLANLDQVQLTFLTPPLLPRCYRGAELFIQVVAVLANFLCFVAVGKLLQSTLGSLQ